MRLHELFLTTLASLAGLQTAQAGNVRIAERPQLGPFTTLQAAIDAAAEGESLLVTPDTYASFTIDGKSVNLFVTGSGEATLFGDVVVKNLAAGQSVVLTRLHVTGGESFPVPGAALTSPTSVGTCASSTALSKGSARPPRRVLPAPPCA
jgi:hypothetical protein